MSSHTAMIIGVPTLLMFIGLLDALFGRVVGLFVGVGVGGPAFMAFYYYVLDIEGRSRRKRGDQIQDRHPDQPGSP